MRFSPGATNGLDKIFARRADEMPVYSIPLAEAYRLPDSAPYLRSLRFDPTNVTQITVVRKGVTIWSPGIRRGNGSPGLPCWVLYDEALNETPYRMGHLDAARRPLLGTRQLDLLKFPETDYLVTLAMAPESPLEQLTLRFGGPPARQSVRDGPETATHTDSCLNSRVPCIWTSCATSACRDPFPDPVPDSSKPVPGPGRGGVLRICWGGFRFCVRSGYFLVALVVYCFFHLAYIGFLGFSGAGLEVVREQGLELDYSRIRFVPPGTVGGSGQYSDPGESDRKPLLVRELGFRFDWKPLFRFSPPRLGRSLCPVARAARAIEGHPGSRRRCSGWRIFREKSNSGG